MFPTQSIERRLRLLYNKSMKPPESELRRLYLDERKTTYQIAGICGVSRPCVCRWLRAVGIPLRPANNGLVHRGIAPPNADDLRRMIHVEHMSYEAVAAKYGVDFTAVPHWLKKHGIDCPKSWTTRRKGEAPEIREGLVRERLAAGLTLADIAKEIGVSKWSVSQFCEANAITKRRDGFNGGVRYEAKNGLLVRSTYELRVAEWLLCQGIAFAYEPRIPMNRRLRADFFAGGWYIEIWGVAGSKKYATQKAKKQSVYMSNMLPLIELSYQHFANGAFIDRLRECLTPAESQGLLFPPHRLGDDADNL